MTLRLDENYAAKRTMSHEGALLHRHIGGRPTWRTTMLPVEDSQQWRVEVGAWLEIAHTVDNPPEDTR